MQELIPHLEKQYFAFVKNGSYEVESYKEVKLYDSLNPEVLISNGWFECFYSGIFAPIKACVKVLDKTNGASFPVLNTVIEKLVANQIIYFDELQDIFLMAKNDPPTRIWVNESDNNLKTTSAKNAKNNPSVYETIVQRKVNVLSLFPTYFKDHSNADAKAFTIPHGEAFGLEIETLFNTVVDKLRFSIFVGTKYPKWTCERDGSLEDSGGAKDCGLELVSPPLSYNKLLEDLLPITREAQRHNGKGHFEGNGLWYGMHINCNIHGPSQIAKAQTAKKFICLINHIDLRTFWLRVARRDGASIEKYCPFKTVEFESCLSTESGSDGKGHYRAAYYRVNSSCVEVRIFRSNLQFDAIAATVELLKIALEFCMNTSDYYNIEKFKLAIVNKGSARLLNYLRMTAAMQHLECACVSMKLGLTTDYIA